MNWLKRLKAHLRRNHDELKATQHKPLLVVRSSDPDQPVRLRTDTDLFQWIRGIEMSDGLSMTKKEVWQRVGLLEQVVENLTVIIARTATPEMLDDLERLNYLWSEQIGEIEKELKEGHE